MQKNKNLMDQEINALRWSLSRDFELFCNKNKLDYKNVSNFEYFIKESKKSEDFNLESQLEAFNNEGMFFADQDRDIITTIYTYIAKENLYFPNIKIGYILMSRNQSKKKVELGTWEENAMSIFEEIKQNFKVTDFYNPDEQCFEIDLYNKTIFSLRVLLKIYFENARFDLFDEVAKYLFISIFNNELYYHAAVYNFFVVHKKEEAIEYFNAHLTSLEIAYPLNELINAVMEENDELYDKAFLFISLKNNELFWAYKYGVDPLFYKSKYGERIVFTRDDYNNTNPFYTYYMVKMAYLYLDKFYNPTLGTKIFNNIAALLQTYPLEDKDKHALYAIRENIQLFLIEDSYAEIKLDLFYEHLLNTNGRKDGSTLISYTQDKRGVMEFEDFKECISHLLYSKIIKIVDIGGYDYLQIGILPIVLADTYFAADKLTNRVKDILPKSIKKKRKEN